MFTILTGARTTETREATHSEIDRKAKVWTIPAERMKNKRGKRKAEPHRVPLSERAVEILEALPSEKAMSLRSAISRAASNVPRRILIFPW